MPWARQQWRAFERKLRQRTAAAWGALLVLCVALAAGPPVQAAVFNVTNLDDAGAGSLRQAILDANAASGADDVTFQAGLSGTIVLESGQLDVTDSVDVQGPGAAVIAVNGNGSSRIFNLDNGSALLDVTISGLTITFGSAASGAGINDVGENLVLDGVAITQNAATSTGGGLRIETSGTNQVTIRSSAITGNTADGTGGGIQVESLGGPLLIQDSAISSNFSGGAGGGIYFNAPGGDVTIENSTVSGNGAQAGGGLYFVSPGPSAVIENCTISGNQTFVGDGGGIYLTTDTLDLQTSTVASNTAIGNGGGVFSADGVATIVNSIVGDNTAAADNDLGTGAEGSFEVGFSLIESPGAATITDNGGNVFNQDAQLGPLQNNGGPTQTHLPAGASPAVNAGDPAFTPPPATDQRGLARVVNGRLDMGSVEINPGTLQLAASAASVNENAGTITITATRTGGLDGAVSVSYTTSDGTATQPDDYLLAAGSLNWANQDGAPKSFQVTIVDDTTDEPDETFDARISSPQGGAALGSPATEVVTIVDNDLPPNPGTIQLTASAASVNENAGTITITATRTGGVDGAVSVSYTTSDGTAMQPGDYLMAAGSLNWADQDGAPKSFQVTIVNDATDEPDETFNVTISSPQGGAVLGSPATEVVTIVDDALAPPVVTIPTLGDVGKLLFAALFGLGGLLLLRRRA